MKKPKKKKKISKKNHPAARSLPQKKQKSKYVMLNVLPEDLWLKVRKGTTVWEALEKTDVELEGDCGGMGKCGKCKIRAISSVRPPVEEEKELLDPEELKNGVRLACRLKIRKDLVIHTGKSDDEPILYQILKAGHGPTVSIDPLINKRPVDLSLESGHEGLSDLDRVKAAMGPEYRNLKASLHCLRFLPQMLKKTENNGTAVLHEAYLMAWQNQEQAGRVFGLVFDLGTSTLVGKLVNLLNGSEVATISRLNSQSKYGSNVISRLQYIKENPKALFTLTDLIVKDLNSITQRLLEVEGLTPDDIFIAVAAGNTTMQHIFLNLNPLGIAGAPFSPVLTDGLILSAKDAGLRLHPEAMLYVMPAKSGYIGGDMISTILASSVAEQDDKMILGLDLGTNGEIFLGNRQKLLTCSAAAGPALEGAQISQGMIARSGAIEGINFHEDKLHYQVIGNVLPKGICGSGLVDLVAVLLHCGIIDSQGLILPAQKNADDYLSSRVITKSGVQNFLVASQKETSGNRQIYLTQKDVRELQLAKGAVAAGIQTLMDNMGIGIQDIDQICLAGALGNFVNPYSAMRIGLLPAVDPEKIKSLGNAASKGAVMVLLSRHYWQMANELSKSIEHVELSTHLEFNRYFVDNLNFPDTNLW
ncbi:MAG: ASKHA domain-containing protein [Desulfobacterales bacterium]